jgi:hypothetical protein
LLLHSIKDDQVDPVSTTSQTSMARTVMAPIAMVQTAMVPIAMAQTVMVPIAMVQTAMVPIAMAPIATVQTAMVPIAMVPIAMAARSDLNHSSARDAMTLCAPVASNQPDAQSPRAAQSPPDARCHSEQASHAPVSHCRSRNHSTDHDSALHSHSLNHPVDSQREPAAQAAPPLQSAAHQPERLTIHSAQPPAALSRCTHAIDATLHRAELQASVSSHLFLSQALRLPASIEQVER